MIDEKGLRVLKNSILTVSAFTEQVHHINSVEDFMIIHNRNLEAITKIANQRNSEYLKIKISEYPILSCDEVKEYIKLAKNDLTVLDLFLGYFSRCGLRYLKTGSFTGRRIKLKMIQIRELNKYVLEVIENPYMETVYKLINSGSYNSTV